MELSTFDPRSDWTPPRVATLPSWDGAQRVAIDVETRDPGLRTLGPGVRRDGYMVGVSFAIEDGPAHYLPIRHAGGGNLDVDVVLRYLRDQAAAFRGDVVGANLLYDLDYLAHADVEFRPRFFRDVLVAEPLLDELQHSYALDAVAKRRGLLGKSEDHLRAAAAAWGVDVKAGLWQLPAAHVGVYAEEDARLPLRLLRRQERAIEKQDLWGVYDLESRLLPVLLRMRRRGVAIDFDRLDEVEAWALSREVAALAEATRLTGVKLSPSDTLKASALAPVFEQVGVVLPLTPKTKKPSITTEVLEGIEHPVGALVREARKFNKLRTTFVRSIRSHETNGRVHCVLRQAVGEDDSSSDVVGARYGRLSCSNPNLQQQPGRDSEIGPRWRQIYVPDTGGEWACLDFSQQEPRWLVHYADVTGLVGAKKAADAYRNDASTDMHQMMADLTGLSRKDAKTIFLALIYGMGGGALCRKLGLPVKLVRSRRDGRTIEVAGWEGRQLLGTFNTRAPFVQKLAKDCVEWASKQGYVRTVSGRRCRFPEDSRGGYDFTFKALNRKVQGSSGDQTKMAMVAADEAGFELQLQVHDEVDLSVQDRRTLDELAEIMRTCCPCTVPHKIDVEIGPSWGEIG